MRTCWDECCMGEQIPSQLLGEAVHVARKEHRCSECTGTIKPGQVYRRVFLLVDGDPWVDKLHLDGGECAEQANAINDSRAAEYAASR